LQIQAYNSERNPTNHSAGDSIDRMDLDYWAEQIKATVAIVGTYAIPVAVQ
jgi:hypothetical protein